MIHHISLRVADMDKTVEFYLKALAPLGFVYLPLYPTLASLYFSYPPLFSLSADQTPS